MNALDMAGILARANACADPDVLALLAEVERLTADLARLRATPELAAIGARAAAALRTQCDGYAVFHTNPCATDVGTLLAHIAAQQAAHAAALDAAVAAARAETLREAERVARAEMALWANALDRGSEVAVVRHRTASDIAAAVAALAAPRGR